MRQKRNEQNPALIENPEFLDRFDDLTGLDFAGLRPVNPLRASYWIFGLVPFAFSNVQVP